MMGEFGFDHALPICNVMAPVDPLFVLVTLEAAGVTRLYPGFHDWFFGKVVPGIRTGERRMIPVTADGKLTGVAICKRTEAEKKLCTLWVAPEARRHGVAADLANDAFAWLGTSKPLFTVPEELVVNFSGLLRAWSFPQPVPYPELYRQERVEYVFNGRIDEMAH
jgi:GNAT superfamily N-acetyltransferase